MIKALGPHLEDAMVIKGMKPKMRMDPGMWKLVLQCMSLWDDKMRQPCWPEQLAQEIKYNQVFNDVMLIGNPEWILPSNYKYHTFGKVIIRIDDCSGDITHKLLTTPIMMFGGVTWCVPWYTKSPIEKSVLCAKCFSTMHNTDKCTAHFPVCAHCTKSHDTALHKDFCEKCITEKKHE